MIFWLCDPYTGTFEKSKFFFEKFFQNFFLGFFQNREIAKIAKIAKKGAFSSLAYRNDRSWEFYAKLGIDAPFPIF